MAPKSPTLHLISKNKDGVGLGVGLGIDLGVGINYFNC